MNGDTAQQRLGHVETGSREPLSRWYLVPPITTLFLILPIVADMPPLRVPQNLNTIQILVVLPFYVGLAAAPGWVYVWSGHYDRRRLTLGKRIWAAASLWAALIASIGGFTTILAIVPFPAVVASALACALLLKRFYRAAGCEPSELSSLHGP